MPEPFWLALALLPVAAWSGWWAATRAHMRGERRQRNAISSNYFKGLNYLLNEQPDKAIEVFLKLAEINTETAETHLALGNLFRRRGEVDKAIRFHRHIIGRSNLSEQHRTQALLELGEDYMRAGLLDRAEKLFSELAEDGRYSEVAIRSLLSIYQQEKDWKNAIVQARRLEQVRDRDTSALIAQFHCELAAEAGQDGDPICWRQTWISNRGAGRTPRSAIKRPANWIRTLPCWWSIVFRGAFPSRGANLNCWTGWRAWSRVAKRSPRCSRSPRFGPRAIPQAQ